MELSRKFLGLAVTSAVGVMIVAATGFTKMTVEIEDDYVPQAISYPNTNGNSNADKEITPQRSVTSTANTMVSYAPITTMVPSLSEIPDQQYLPIYPSAEITTFIDTGYANRTLIYIAPDDEAAVFSFYDEALLIRQQGWVKTKRGRTAHYEWTDPAGVSPWHLQAVIDVAPLEDDKSEVYVEWLRWPDLQNFPLYMGAQLVQTGQEEQALRPDSSEIRPSIITTITYTVPATPLDVENYYNVLLPEHGWEHWNTVDENSDRLDEPAPPGTITADIGVSFVSRRLAPERNNSRETTSIVLLLNIRARSIGPNETQVTLVVRDSEYRPLFP